MPNLGRFHRHWREPAAAYSSFRSGPQARIRNRLGQIAAVQPIPGSDALRPRRPGMTRFRHAPSFPAEIPPCEFGGTVRKQNPNCGTLRRRLQKFLQLAVALGCGQLLEPAHVRAVDEDLRHGAGTRRPVQHLGACRGIGIDAQLAPSEPLGLQQILRSHAVAARRGGVDFDVGHDENRGGAGGILPRLNMPEPRMAAGFAVSRLALTLEPIAHRRVSRQTRSRLAMPFRLRPLLTFAATLALSLPALAQQADVRLPSLGSSADTVMSPQDAHAYGAEFLRELRAAHLVLDDPQVDQYLRTLGYRLASASSDPTQQYTFTLINVPEINSFATFGGYVFIFSGMVTATRTQDELAAVMAHELAHVSQHHLQRAMEDQKKALPLYLLGTLAAAMAASRMDSNHPVVTNPYGYGYGNNVPYDGGVDPVAGVIASGLGLIEQHQIEFTRKDEEEADHVGIETLAKAGFNPEGMADVFAHMQALMRPGGDGGMAAGNIPDFLQDHPVSSVRIADARARARVLDQQMHLVTACVSVRIDPPHCT